MNENNFHPNPQVRRAREADSGKKEPAGKKPIEQGKDDAKGKGPASSVETQRKEDGSYHTITRHADGQEEHADHATHDDAKAHEDQAFGEDGGDDMGEMEEESSEVCPDCNGEGCETCGGTGMKQAQAEGDLSS